MATPAVVMSNGSLFSTKQPTARHVEIIEKEIPKARPDEKAIMYTINDLLIERARLMPNVSLLAYPGSSKGADDYVHYTASDLDRFADEAAKKYMALGLPVKVRKSDVNPEVIFQPSE